MAMVVATTLFILLASASVDDAASTSPAPSPSFSSFASPFSTIDVLIAFKHAISGDPLRALASWADNSTTISTNSTSADFCSWVGIVCCPNSTRLTAISLPSKLLSGSITPLLGQLPHLSHLDLSSNSFSGSIPPELGSCASLSYLSLEQNLLVGSLPASFTNLTSLKTLSLSSNFLVGTIPPLALPRLSNLTLSFNYFSGNIPVELAQCSSLHILDLNDNYLNGSLPSALGNLTRLVYVDLSANQFHGILPASLANCSRLQHLNLYSNTISGNIPASWGIGLKKNLLFLSLGINNCSGEVPLELGYLSKLQYIELGSNHFTGKILNLLVNCSDLSIIDVWGNSFSDNLSPELGSALPKLNILSLIKNQFSGSIPPSLGNCSGLSKLVLGFNKLSGNIPATLFQAHNITYLDLQYNNLSGSIPPKIGNETMLSRLLVNNNQLTGILPPELGNLALVEGVNMEFNHFSGNIPYQLGNLTKATVLCANRNLLQGSIPSSFGQLAKLNVLILDNNMLTGSIPTSLSNCTRFRNISLNNNFLEGPILEAAFPSMVYFDVALNRLSGSIPPSIGVMNQLQILDLSNNFLSGEIPSVLSNCVDLLSMNLSSNNLTGAIPVSGGTFFISLIALNLSHNSISGEIPKDLGSLTNLLLLDASFNRLSNSIPVSLDTISGLTKVNFSYNQLEGAIPTQGSFGNLTAASFMGNPGLCGQILHKPCRKPSHHISKGAVIGLSVASFIVVLFLSFCCFFYIKRHNLFAQDLPLLAASPFLRLKLEDIRKATDDFSEKNIIGKGGTGVVFKGILSDGKVLAFKRLTLSEILNVRAATAELQSLGKIKHRNLVRLLGYFFDQTHDILFLEYMPKGSLDEHLYPAADEATVDVRIPQLSWTTRLGIARDIAHGLAYLHHECPTTIVHCDIKPRNILLDSDMVARITDFGLARVLMQARSISSTQVIGGTLGYVAPEYATTGQISRKCDVYSYGIVVMEMVSGRRPTGTDLAEGESMVAWAQGCVEKGTVEEMVEWPWEEKDVQEIERVLKVALMCAAEDPKRRPTMQEVVEWLPPSVAIDVRPPAPFVEAYALELREGWAEDSEG